MSYTEWLEGLERDAPHLSLNWIDAGLAPLEPRGEIVVTEMDLVLASQEELAALQTFELYSNQYYMRESVDFTGDTVIRYKFDTPCITSLR